jgi:SAM-dependent methyltransferase
MTQDWFASWFDTPYYHILYQYRDDTEARVFIDKLFAHLNPGQADKILDLACGRGRHAIYMNQKGFDVTGYDLAEENINFARQFENAHLHFAVRDMRSDLGTAAFDWVFNLFTSFGYFEDEGDDLRAMQSIAHCLKPEGKLVLDFMNVKRVSSRLVPKEVKTAEGIEFHIQRYADETHIIKEIAFEADNRNWKFEERVKKYTKADFQQLFQEVGLQPLAYFGSLDLEPFDTDKSDRLIMIVAKP